jgi:hypothetical protein
MKILNTLISIKKNQNADSPISPKVALIADYRTKDLSGLTFGGGHAPVCLMEKVDVRIKQFVALDPKTQDKSGLSFGAGYAPQSLVKRVKC